MEANSIFYSSIWISADDAGGCRAIEQQGRQQGEEIFILFRRAASLLIHFWCMLN